MRAGAGDVAGGLGSAEGDDGWVGFVEGRWGGRFGGLLRDHGWSSLRWLLVVARFDYDFVFVR